MQLFPLFLSSLILGISELENCPSNPNVPIYLILAGSMLWTGNVLVKYVICWTSLSHNFKKVTLLNLSFFNVHKNKLINQFRVLDHVGFYPDLCLRSKQVQDNFSDLDKGKDNGNNS